VYRAKCASNESLERHKAHLVSKSFSQVEYIYYNETFSLIAKMNSIHLILSLTTLHKWDVHYIDVKSSLLHGDSKEEIYMEQPPGYVWNGSSLFSTLRNILMVLSKLFELSMPKWTTLFLKMDFLDANYS
jgi:hypothetical protein